LSDSELSLEARAEAQFDDGIGRGRLARAAPVLGLTARTAGEAVVAGLRGADRAEFHIRTAERYAELLGRSKGALMKAGQMLSLAPGGPVLPGEFRSIYQAALARLRDDVPPMAGELARDVLEHELGRPTESVFAEFDWEPLAAASIGQVHAARLRDGREVAVKIQYPGVAAAIDADLKNTELLATLMSLVGGLSPRRMSADLRGMAREMSARICEELDYRLEAANQAEFVSLYRGHPFIHVPQVVDELCTSRVLTQELVRGLTWGEAIMAEQRLRNQWAEAIWRFIWGTHIRFGLFNADPHPGNYIFHEDGSVSFVDFGCVKRFHPEQVKMATEIGRACVEGDVLGTWRACVEIGFWRSCDPVTPEEIYAYWREPFELYWGEQPFTVTPEYAERYLERHYSPNGPSANAFRYIVASPDYTVMSRIETGAISVIAHLDATVHWQAVGQELYQGAPSLTEMGRRECAFFEHQRASFV
jgi:predicted unusual protein kinase regulating ubiquinone biosynthesis (AarF/ABC1/UbiB family)